MSLNICVCNSRFTNSVCCSYKEAIKNCNNQSVQLETHHISLLRQLIMCATVPGAKPMTLYFTSETNLQYLLQKTPQKGSIAKPFVDFFQFYRVLLLKVFKCAGPTRDVTDH